MCGAVPPRVISGFHGDIRLESASGARGSLTGSVRGSLSGIVLGSLSDIVPRIFVGRCAAVVIFVCRRGGALSFIIINHKLRVNAGRSSLRVRAFAAVCGILSACGFFICRGLAADSGENAGFTPESFFSPRGRTRALRSACLPKKFSRGYGTAGEGAFPTDFPFGSRG